MAGKKTKTVEERFWSKVNLLEPDDCWEWTASKRQGYGRFGVEKGYIEYAHRWLWERLHGPIPEGLFICHRCDNPGCVNPNHLFLGTHLENMEDMREKQRTRRNLRHPHTKLSDDDVRAIRVAVANGTKTRDLALTYGVHQCHINAVVSGHRRKYVV